MNFASVMLGVIGWEQIILILVIVLLLFGGRKIPELMRGLGGGVKEFKSAMKEGEKENSSTNSETEKK